MPPYTLLVEVKITGGFWSDRRTASSMLNVPSALMSKSLRGSVTEVVTVPGKVDYRDQQVWFRGQEASYSFLDESGWFSGIDYGLTGSVANGSAGRSSVNSLSKRMTRTADCAPCGDWAFRDFII